MKSFEQARGSKSAKAHGAKASLGTSRAKNATNQDHLQGPEGISGHSAPNRTVRYSAPELTMGYHVTSPAATPSEVMDLKRRP